MAGPHTCMSRCREMSPLPSLTAITVSFRISSPSSWLQASVSCQSNRRVHVVLHFLPRTVSTLRWSYPGYPHKRSPQERWLKTAGETINQKVVHSYIDTLSQGKHPWDSGHGHHWLLESCGGAHSVSTSLRPLLERGSNQIFRKSVSMLDTKLYEEVEG
jgi:hypothetical protein